MTEFDFEDAATLIVDWSRERRADGLRGSVWSEIVTRFGADGYCDASLVSVIEDKIAVHLRSLRAAELRRLWSGTESGANDPHLDCTPASELRTLLEPELLARIIEIASDEARPADRRRPRRRDP